MTAHPIAPMTDAELAALRVESTIKRSSHHTMASVSIDAMQRLFALVDALQARALPPARLMRTVEEVEGLANGRYLLASPNPCNCGLLFARPTAEPRFSINGVPLWPFGVRQRLVGATVVGPLPDVEPLGEEG